MAKIEYLEGGAEAHLGKLTYERGVAGVAEFDVLCDGFACRARVSFENWEQEPAFDDGEDGDGHGGGAPEWGASALAKIWLPGSASAQARAARAHGAGWASGSSCAQSPGS